MSVPVTFGEIRDDVAAIAKPILEALGDGKLSIGEALEALPVITRKSMELIGSLKDTPGPAKKALACEAVRYVYKDLLDPNIPFVPQWIEEPVEDFILAHIVPFLIDELFALLPSAFGGGDD